MNNLTRWNRAGLSRLQYIEGNAAVYLENLRLALRNEFASEPGVLQWLGENTDTDSYQNQLTFLLTQYRHQRRDYAWELLRTYARAFHILAHTSNAYANERYLRTATQWDNVRRLVNLLDYHPAPPASAETWIALFAKGKEQAIGTVDTGLAIQNKPKDGSAAFTFETLEDFTIDYRLNALRVPNYNRSHKTVPLISDGRFALSIDTLPKNISIGVVGIINDNNSSAAVKVTQIMVDRCIELEVIEPDFNATFSLADLSFSWQADTSHQALLNGDNVVKIDRPITANIDNVYVYPSNKMQNYSATRIVAIDGTRIELSSVSLSYKNKNFYPTNLVKSRSIGGYNRHIIPKDIGFTSVWLNSIGLESKVPDKEPIYDGDIDTGEVHYTYISGDQSNGVFYLAEDTPAAFKVLATSVDPLTFSGKAGDLASGQFVLLKSSNGQWYSKKITTITQNVDTFTVQVNGSLPKVTAFTELRGLWKKQQKDREHNQDKRTLCGTLHYCQTHSIQVTLEDFPETLTFGRQFWIVSSLNSQRVTLVDAKKITGTTDVVQLRFAETIIGSDFLRYDTIIYGNVILSGHGESKEITVLGSGDRTQANQSFIYANTDVSFVQNTQFSSGVMAALRIWVDKREWTQVENLRNSESTDTHFQVRLNEEQQPIIEFGDGTQGQRLATGVNNVQIQARIGHGIKGNLAAGDLEKLKKPHKFVDSILHIEDCTGGGDLESSESLRAQAPAATLTLSRAVSIADYESLAKRQSSVWQAKAYSPPPTPGSTDQVYVVIVPAGGGVSGNLLNNLKTTLENQSRPGVNVTTFDYEGLLLELDITVRINTTAYYQDEVAEAVRIALIDRFTLEQSQFDQSIYRSHIFHTVESVEGVENADCLINPTAHTNGFINDRLLATTPAQVYRGEDNLIRRLTPSSHQVIYLNANIKPPMIRTEKFNG